MMTVGELIKYLETFDPALPCCFQQHSDWTELETFHITVEDLQSHRGDGYVGSRRPDRPSVKWLTFPGN